MVTTEQLADWQRRLEKALSRRKPEPFDEAQVRDVAKEIEQAWLEALRRECA